jgi:hypothetical protein
LSTSCVVYSPFQLKILFIKYNHGMCLGNRAGGGGGGVSIWDRKKCYLLKDLSGKPRNDKWQFVTIVNIRLGVYECCKARSIQRLLMVTSIRMLHFRHLKG